MHAEQLHAHRQLGDGVSHARHFAGNRDGGGAADCTLNNCTLTGNSACITAAIGRAGGGAYGCTLNNCTLSGNSATQSAALANGSFNDSAYGGGAYGSTLNNCTLTGNSVASTVDPLL